MDYNNVFQEQIKERPINRKKLLKRMLITILTAFIFGVVACITFAIVLPRINNALNPEKEPVPVYFPEESEEISPEDMAIDDTELQIRKEGDVSVWEKAEEEEIVEETEEETISQIEQDQLFHAELNELAVEIRKSMVSVTGVTSDVNWMNDILQNEGQTTGLIVADNGLDLLILADYSKLEKAENILVEFPNDVLCEATIKGKDKETHMAILQIPLESITEATRKSMLYANLGSSKGKSSLGHGVLALGSPNGIWGSISYGMVTSQGVELGLPDSNYKMLTTDIYGSTTANGVIANTSGQIIGIIYDSSSVEDMENQICAIGISELKRTIERLSNGEPMLYTGIHGTEVTSAIRTRYNLPAGAYITEVDIGSPAMRAGIQNGDIIVKVDGEEIVSFSEWVKYLNVTAPDQTITMTIERQGVNGYQEMELELTVQEQAE